MSKLIKLYCKNCGAELEISDDREFCYCMYCGTKMLIPADRKFIHINKNVNVSGKVEHIQRKESGFSHFLSKREQAKLEKERIKAEKEAAEKRTALIGLAICFGSMILIILLTYVRSLFH